MRANLLKEVSERLQQLGVNKSSNLFANIVKFVKNNDDFNQYRSAQVILLGISDENTDFNQVREELYSMYFHGKKIDIIDLGDIYYSKEKEVELKELITLFIENNSLVITFGNIPEILKTLYNSINSKKEKISITYVSPTANIANGFINSIINDTDIFDFNIIGHQLYLSDPKDLEYLSNNYFKTLRLGSIRGNLLQSEPLIRDSQLLGLELSAIRQIDVPGIVTPSPNGLYAEEICQLSRYAGLSENLNLVYINGQFLGNERVRTSRLIAQIIWHFIDGYIHRINENLLNNVNGVKKIIVNLDNSSRQLIFYHSSLSNRWWMEVSGANNTISSIVACLAEDYKIACNQELPLRWIWYHQKLLSKHNNFKTS